MKPSGTTSLWTASFTIQDRPPLAQDLDVDVCVIGGGIAGLSVAYQLACSRQRVALLESGSLGGGETGRTTAHLASAQDDGHAELERLHGPEAARLAAQSHAAAIDELERIARVEKIECDFARVPGYLFLPPEGDFDKLVRERAAARRARLDVEWEREAPLPGFHTGRALRFANQGQLHPLRYLDGLARAAERKGALLFCRTRALEVEPGSRPKVSTDRGRIVRASSVVVATNSPITDRVAIHNKQESLRSYVIAAPIERGKLQRALYWDTLDSYHYVRLHPGSRDGLDWLIVGGEDHGVGREEAGEERFESLLEWARARFPAMGAPVHRWSGEVREPVDGLAFIGADPSGAENLYVVTGDSGQGITGGTLAGMLLRDLLLGQPNPWERLYRPSRTPARALRGWTAHNLGAAAKGYARHLLPGGARSAADIAPGQGALVRRGLRLAAVHKTEDGRVIERSAVCPHLGACVRWNGVERSWDCPAHGSRFAPDGSVLAGPANAPLAPAPPPKRGRARRAKRAPSGGRASGRPARPRSGAPRPPTR